MRRNNDLLFFQKSISEIEECIDKLGSLVEERKNINLRNKKIVLLTQVEYNYFNEVSRIIDQNIDMIFEPSQFTYHNTSKVTTPLKLAVEFLDIPICHLFLEKIKNDPQRIENFIQQINEVKTYDFNPVFIAYEIFLEKMDLWKRKLISDDEINHLWTNIGKLQREFPEHLLKEMNNDTSNWHKKSKFDGKPLSDLHGGIVADKNTVCGLRAENAGLGYGLALLAGVGHPVLASGVWVCENRRWDVAADLANLRRFNEVKIEQLNSLKQNLGELKNNINIKNGSSF